jgi:hypothetical protein
MSIVAWGFSRLGAEERIEGVGRKNLSREEHSQALTKTNFIA